MRGLNALPDLISGTLWQSYLPDFVLGFAFFCSLAYGVLAKRFDRQRPAVAISAALGLSLSIGLVWWEQQNGLSIRNLGPFAVGFAILVLGAVMFQAIRQVGGSVAGIGIALGAALLVSSMLDVHWWLAPEIIRTAVTVALVVGILAFLTHTRWHAPPLAVRTAVLPAARHDMRDLRRFEQEGHVTSDLLGRRLRGIRQEADFLNLHPELAGNVAQQIRRTLPAEGWLTERLAELRKKAHQVRHSHVARLKETRQVFANLPISAKKRASAALAARYAELAGMDKRLERLDRSAAACEKKIRELTEKAEQAARRDDYRKLTELLKKAETLQKHNSKLFAAMDRTEKKLTAVAERAAQEAREVSRA